jgi:hypothetical protein
MNNLLSKQFKFAILIFVLQVSHHTVVNAALIKSKCAQVILEPTQNIADAVAIAQTQSRSASIKAQSPPLTSKNFNILRRLVGKPTQHSNILEIEIAPEQFAQILKTPTDLAQFDSVRVVAEAPNHQHAEYTIATATIIELYHKRHPEQRPIFSDFSVKRVFLQRKYHHARIAHEQQRVTNWHTNSFELNTPVTVSYYDGDREFHFDFMKTSQPEVLKYFTGYYTKFRGQPAFQTVDGRIIKKIEQIVEIRKVDLATIDFIPSTNDLLVKTYKSFGSTWGTKSHREVEWNFTDEKPFTPYVASEVQSRLRYASVIGYGAGLAMLFVGEDGELKLAAYDFHELEATMTQNKVHEIVKEKGLQLPDQPFIPFNNVYALVMTSKL